MDKNDKYYPTIIIILAVALLGALAFEIKHAVAVVTVLLIFFIVQQFTAFERRIQQLEQQYQVTASVDHLYLPQWALYLGTLIGLAGYYLHSGSAILVGSGLVLFSLIQMLSSMNERLKNLENHKNCNRM